MVIYSTKQYSVRSIASRLLTPYMLIYIVFGLLASVAVQADDSAVVKKYTALARKSIDFGSNGLPEKLDFRFDNATAWLRQNGDFGIEAEIKHGWLLCGDYQVGLRFGIGSPACTNVSWVTEPHYVTKRKQCNNAWMVHSGAGSEVDITDDFAQITCAQMLIKCTGKCK
jgi:hypothetical protein